MRRREFLLGSLAASTALAEAGPRAASAQTRERVHKLGFLTTTSGPAERHRALLASLANLGYREGDNLVIERRYAAGDFDRLPRLAADLVRANVDVIVTETIPAALAAKRATSRIPIVMATGADALGSGVITSLAHPGGNVTGNTIRATDLVGKKVQFLRELRPNARTIAWLGNAQNVPEQLAFRELQTIIAPYPVTAMFADAPVTERLATAFATMAAAGVDTMIVAESATNTEAAARIVELAVRYQLPIVYGRREFADAGGLLSYGTNFVDLFRRAATLVDKIFKGANPADLPVQQATKFELVINLKGARALGLTVPRSLLLRADEVIE